MLTAQNIDQAVDILLLNFVAEKSTAICSMLVPIAISGLTTYLLFIGLNVARGEASGSAKDVCWKVLRISFVVTISLNVGTYQAVIVDGFDSIGGSVIQAISGVTTFPALLDEMAEPFASLGQKLWSDATTGIWPHLGLLFAAAVISLSQAVLFSVGLGFYLLAKISLALAMSLGPIFLLCALWPSTQKYAENWLGQALNYVFLKVFVCTVVVMLTSFASEFAEHINDSGETINVVSSACALLISCIALTITMIFLPYLASALFGGASISGIGRAAMHALLLLLRDTGAPPRVPSNSISGHGAQSLLPSPSDSPLYQRQVLNQIQQPAQRRNP